MRILHVTGTLDPAAGGPPSVTVRLASAQAGLGHDVTILCYSTDEVQRRVQKAYDGVPSIHRLQQRSIKRGSRWESLTAREARRVLMPLLEDRDVVHLHGVWERLLLMTAVLARKRGIPYIVTPHGMLDPWSLRQSVWKKRLALALGYRRMLDSAAFLHVLNEDEGRLIEPLGLSAPRVTIPNGVFLEEIEPLPLRGTFRRRLGLNEEPVILFLGRLHFKKGLDILASAFRIVSEARPDAHLVVAGPDGGEQAIFERSIRSLGLAERTHVVGSVYGSDKLSCLVDADVFCLPSRQEGFSVAILEALACGLPVVISAECHFPEVHETGAGLVTELNAGKTAEGLLDIVNNPQKRRSLAENALRLVRERYTWPEIARRSVVAYEETLSRTTDRTGTAIKRSSL